MVTSPPSAPGCAQHPDCEAIIPPFRGTETLLGRCAMTVTAYSSLFTVALPAPAQGAVTWARTRHGCRRIGRRGRHALYRRIRRLRR